MSFIGLISSSH